MPKNIVWVLGWHPKHPYLCTTWARKGVFEYLGWGCLNAQHQKMWVFGVALQARIPQHQICQKECFWIPSMEVFEMRNFRRPHPRYPKPLLLADLVQRYARLGRHAKNPHFLALCISNTFILGIQKRFGGQMWCRGTRAWSATPKPQFFRHCALQTSLY